MIPEAVRATAFGLHRLDKTSHKNQFTYILIRGITSATLLELNMDALRCINAATMRGRENIRN